MSFLEFLKERHNDRLFYGTVWLIGKFTSNFQVVIIVIGLLTCYFLLSSIYRYSPCVSLSAFLLFCLGYFAYLYCILRQGLAIAIVFWGYRYIERREYKKYIIVILIASLVHITAVIGMIMLLLVDDHFTRKRVLKYILLFFACIVAARYGITVLTKWYRIDYSQTAVSGKGVKLFLFRSGILFLLCLKYRSVVSANPKIRLFYSSFIVGLALQILAMGLSILTRLTGYYAISLIIIVPYVLQQIHIPRNKVIFGCMTFGIGFMFYVYTLVNDLSGSVPYYFMWNR